MRIAALVLGIIVAVFVMTASPVAAQGCLPGVVGQADMAGVYVSPDHRMRVEMFPCGGTYIQWDNPPGLAHAGAYASVGRLPGGGVGARWSAGSQLDFAWTIGFKPAEPGFIQVITLDPYGGPILVYRLRKIV